MMTVQKQFRLEMPPKTVSDGDDVTSCGRLFKTRVAATGKERSPIIVECTIFGTTNTAVAAELSRCRDSTSVIR